jgi:small-conductance mechanosensitive channel
LVIGGLLVLLTLAIVGSILTRDTDDTSGRSRRGSRRGQAVDQTPLRTARSMAALAATREEQRYARQALRLADHEVDLAFAVALRQAAEQKTTATSENRALFDQVSRLEAAVKTDQDQLDKLKKQLATVSATQHDDLQGRINLAEAQLELDQDELQDAQGDLMRSGANSQTWIQRQFDRYQASQKENEAALAQPTNNPTEGGEYGNNLAAQMNAWYKLRNKVVQLNGARDETMQAAAKLRESHDILEKQSQAEENNKQELKQEVADKLSAAKPAVASTQSTAATVTSLKQLASARKNLADLDKRIQDHEELGDVYGNWITVVQSYQRAATHDMLRSAIWIVLIVLIAYLLARVIDHAFADKLQEHRRIRTLRVILRFALQAIALLLIVLVVFGIPSQMSTVLGLAGAGLTVALKDFIVAFFGWFVLMGRNGIHVGDWVEINGVVGEVVEINLLRTVLLETGNWTDTGHPTGRKVAFVNGFAIEGHFFNFSTSGQWLWDEIEFLVPAGEDPYPIINAFQEKITAETEANAQRAEQEWERAMGRSRVQAVSAKPAVNLRPTAAGVEVHVRYITSAQERFSMRARLYQIFVDILHHRKTEPAEPVSR